jgi:hypothetical protein
MGCDGCDFPSGKGLGKALDCIGCCDVGSCDWGERKRERKSKRTNQKDEKYVHIPPKSTLR